jgi:hypothetical protein
LGSLEGLDGAFAPDSVAASDAFKMVRALGIGSSSSEYDRGFSIVLMSGVGAAEACPAVSANPETAPSSAEIRLFIDASRKSIRVRPIALKVPLQRDSTASVPGWAMWRDSALGLLRRFPPP